MNQFRSGREVKDYYTAALEGGDYYTAEEQRGRWCGELADRLGLDERVTRETFARLADNQHPWSGENLTPRTNADRTVGYDMNFHVPKGVSVLHLVSHDDRITEAIRESARETMRELERESRTRVRIGGKKEEERRTGSLVWGEFLHTTTRPEAGVPDVHLHVHCFVFNATYDPVEERVKAAQFRDIKRDMPYYEAAFYSRLAHRLEAMGYTTERSGKGWDVAGIPESIKRKFSRRTQAIEDLAKRLGVTDASRKAELGARSRKKKTKTLSPGELRAEWLGRFTPGERDAVESVAGRARAMTTPVLDDEREAARALDAAIAHAFERQSVVAEPRLLETALRTGLGRFRPETLQRAAAEHPELLRRTERNETLVTTRSILAEEEAMLRSVRDGRASVAPLVNPGTWSDTSHRLNKQQARAVEQLLTGTDRVQLLRGGAGTGKTTLLREFRSAVESAGHKLTVLAPTAEASRGVLRRAGFEDADTLTVFLGDPERQRAARGGVLFVDEAGLVGTPTMRKLLGFAEKQRARVILCGDTKQHAPVERGDALRLLETRVGLRPAELTEVVRQTGSYKQAVESLQRGAFDEGIATLDKLGAIREMEGRDYTPLVREYVETVRTGRSSMVIAPTHAEGDGLTDLIRAELRREGVLGRDDRSFLRLRDLRWTEAERADAARYERGQVVQFHLAARSGTERFAAGDRLTIEGRDDRGRVWATDDAGKHRMLPLEKAKSFAVHEESVLRVAPGDWLRASGNTLSAEGRRINNGAVFQVEGFTPEGEIKLKNGWTVPRAFGKLEHGYVSTSHAAQGRTVDAVFIAQGSAGIAASSAEQFYVSVSRGRQSVRIFTDDRKAVIEAVSRMSQRRSAVELVSGRRDHDRSRQHGVALARLARYEETQQRSQGPHRTRERERTKGYGYGG